MAEDTSPKILVVASPKGGVAKTTTSRNLAVIAAREGLSVATVDLDSQRTLTRWWEKRPDNYAKIEHFKADLADVSDIKNMRGFDLLVVDTPPLVIDEDNNKLKMLTVLVSVSDFVLVPTGQHEEDLVSTASWLQFLKMSNARYGAVLTITTRRTKSFETAKKKLNNLGLLCPVDVPRVEDIPYSHSYGLGVVEIAKAKGGDDYESVWHFTRNQLGIQGAN